MGHCPRDLTTLLKPCFPQDNRHLVTFIGPGHWHWPTGWQQLPQLFANVILLHWKKAIRLDFQLPVMDHGIQLIKGEVFVTNMRDTTHVGVKQSVGSPIC